jgi:hypothetical protein
VIEITRDTLWRTKDGTLVAVKNMDDQHLLNTIRVPAWSVTDRNDVYRQSRAAATVAERTGQRGISTRAND